MSSTSPSIYANFHNIITDDICGDATTVVETMLTFSPGELKTMAGQIGPFMYDAKPFDFRDLPCPPQSVMVSSSRLQRPCIERTQLKQYARKRIGISLEKVNRTALSSLYQARYSR